MTMVNECGHPERPHNARNKCEACYQIWYRAEKPGPRPIRIPDCHPDRKHDANGLCAPCWRKEYHLRNKEEHNARSKAYYRANRESQIRISIERRMVRRYDLTLDQIDAMPKRQEGRCVVCGGLPEKLVVDHDHDTGRVRALLCGTCNVRIGMLKDDPSILSAAAQYVYAHKPLTVAA